MDYGVGKNLGVASRTPIDFRAGVITAFARYASDYSLVQSETTSEYVLYVYHRQARPDRNMFFLVQGSRFSGRLQVYVAMNRVPKFPYYVLGEEPDLGTFGYRQTVGRLTDNEDFSFEYGSDAELAKVLRDAVSTYGSRAMHQIWDECDVSLEKAKGTWLPLFEEWSRTERESVSGSLRYPGLVFEDEATQFIRQSLADHTYDHFLGMLRFKYRDERFFLAHVYLMARAYEFLRVPGASVASSAQDAAGAGTAPMRMITWADILGPKPEQRQKADVNVNRQPPLGDPAVGLLGRWPQKDCISLSQDETQRRLEYCFLKSFSALEGLYE